MADVFVAGFMAGVGWAAFSVLSGWALGWALNPSANAAPAPSVKVSHAAQDIARALDALMERDGSVVRLHGRVAELLAEVDRLRMELRAPTGCPRCGDLCDACEAKMSRVTTDEVPHA